jgi:hypothetical protein
MPVQMLFLDVFPGQRTGSIFPRTEEVVGANPITSTQRRPLLSEGFLLLPAESRCWACPRDVHSRSMVVSGHGRER